MKRRIIVVVSVGVVLAVSMFSVSAIAGETATQAGKTTQACPMSMMGGGSQAMMQRCMKMMQMAGVKPEMMQRYKVMMQTPIFMDGPCAVYGQADALKLSIEQKKKLRDIENEAREKALAVLTDEQKEKMGNISEEPIAMIQMCSKMMPMMHKMMHKMMSDRGKSGSMGMCPMMGGKAQKGAMMCPMMGGKAQKGAMMCPMMGGKAGASDNVQAKSPEQVMCPVMNKPIQKNIYTEYRGKKVYFCCSMCKKKFEANPEKYLSKLPQFKH